MPRPMFKHHVLQLELIMLLQRANIGQLPIALGTVAARLCGLKFEMDRKGLPKLMQYNQLMI